MKWYRFSEKKPQDGLFIYSDGEQFYLGRKDLFDEPEVLLMGHKFISDLYDPEISSIIKYWAKISVTQFCNMLAQDIYEEGERAKNDISDDQNLDSVKELQEQRKRCGVLWKPRLQNKNKIMDE